MKVGFIGTAASGKTTLVKELSAQKIYKNHNIINEVAGNFTIKDRTKLSIQLAIMERQIKEEGKYNNFISDRTVLDNYAYFLWHYKKLPSRCAYWEIINEHNRRFHKHLSTKPYDAVFFIDEYFPLEDNGIREIDYGMQEWIFNRLSDIACLYCDVYNIPLYYIAGSVRDRIEQVQDILKPLYVQSRLHDFQTQTL